MKGTILYQCKLLLLGYSFQWVSEFSNFHTPKGHLGAYLAIYFMVWKRHKVRNERLSGKLNENTGQESSRVECRESKAVHYVYADVEVGTVQDTTKDLG